MKNNWTKRLMACILSLALVLLALPAGVGSAFRASASAPSTTDPYASVDEATMIAGQNLGILGNENRLMEWEYNKNTSMYVNTFTGNTIMQFKIAGSPFAITFNAQDTQKRFFGIGMSSIFDHSITKINDDAYMFIEVDGSRRYFLAKNSWKDGYGNSLAIFSNGYTVTSEGRKLTFDESGKIIRFEQTFDMEPNFSGKIPIKADFLYDPEGTLLDVKTDFYGNIHFKPTKPGDVIDAKDIEFDQLPAGFGTKFSWYYSGIMAFGDIRNTDGTGVCVNLSNPLGELYEPNSRVRLSPRYSSNYKQCIGVEQISDATVIDAQTWSFAYGDRQTTVTNPDGAEKIYYFDKWGNPIDGPGPGPDPGPAPAVPVSEQASGLNLGVNTPSNLLSWWDLGSVIHANINAFSGNLVFETKLPNAFSLYYNSQSTQENEFGKYFASEANRVVEKVSDTVYVLTEFDGSRHYFYERSPGSLTDEHGAVLDASGSDTYVVTSGSSTRLTFRKSDGRSTNVIVGTDGTMNSYNSNTFAYYAATDTRGPRVQKIQKNGVDAASFGYNQQGNLTTTIRADGITLLLTYDSTGSVITGIQNIMDSSRLTFAYVTGEDGVRRVSSIQKCDASGTKLDEVTLSYGTDSDGNSQTSVTKADGTETVTSYDEWGNPVAEPEPSVPAEQVAQGLNLGVMNSANLVKTWNLTDGVTAFVNAYNGNIVLQTGIPGVFPLVFNAQGEQQTEFGRDFTSAGNRRIDKISDDVYVMTESDGSLHYFTYDKSPGKLQDERGISLYVRETYYELQNGASYNVKFDKTTGRENTNTYNPDGSIASNGGAITFTYYAATDSRGPRVQNILQNGTSKITLGYRTDGNISTIILANGATLLFTYDSAGSTITGIQNIMDGSRISFSYTKDASGLQRASKIEQFNGSGAKVDEIALSYETNADGNRKTTLQNLLESTTTIYNFDAYGNQI